MQKQLSVPLDTEDTRRSCTHMMLAGSFLPHHTNAKTVISSLGHKGHRKVMYSHDMCWFVSAFDTTPLFPPFLLLAGEGGFDVFVTRMSGLDLTPWSICHR